MCKGLYGKQPYKPYLHSHKTVSNTHINQFFAVYPKLTILGPTFIGLFSCFDPQNDILKFVLVPMKTPVYRVKPIVIKRPPETCL